MNTENYFKSDVQAMLAESTAAINVAILAQKFGRDNVQTRSEGWAIFDCDGSDNGQWQLCRDDELEILKSDDDAWKLVIEKAKTGSTYHIEALEFLKQHNPLEHASIIKAAGEYSH